MAVGFNQAYDLNDASTPGLYFRAVKPDIFAKPTRHQFSFASRRYCSSKRLWNCLRRILTGGNTVPGIPWPLGPPCPGFPNLNYNFDAYSNSGSEGTDLIDTALRVPYLGFDPVEAIQLQSRGNSIYHSGQLNVTKRLSGGVSINLSYTFSKSIDIGSTDPGSTTASGRPDTPNLGLVVQGDQRNLNSNRALSDYDRPHRFAGTLYLAVTQLWIEVEMVNRMAIVRIRPMAIRNAIHDPRQRC